VPSTGSRSRSRAAEPVRVAFRIGSLRYPLLDGAGAASSDDARWNSRGRYVIYAAEHYATALIEIAKIATHRFDEKVANANPIHSARNRHLEP